ncbi:MAG: hypothetical protein ACTSWQ_10470, partial [Candidatus Thorarchaeota archaeon]
MRAIKTIALILLISSFYASPLTEAIDSGENIWLLMRIESADSTVIEEMIPLHEGNEGLMLSSYNIPAITPDREVSNVNMGNLLYHRRPDGFMLGDYKLESHSNWETPGLVIEGADGKRYILNLAVERPTGLELVGHTSISIKATYDREAFDLRSGITQEFVLRPERSSIKLATHFALSSTEDGITVGVAKDAVLLHSTSLYKNRDGLAIGQSQNMSIIIDGNPEYGADIYITPQNL